MKRLSLSNSMALALAFAVQSIAALAFAGSPASLDEVMNELNENQKLIFCSDVEPMITLAPLHQGTDRSYWQEGVSIRSSNDRNGEFKENCRYQDTTLTCRIGLTKSITLSLEQFERNDSTGTLETSQAVLDGGLFGGTSKTRCEISR